MEDFEEQEVEFWRKLGEEGMSRAQILKRSAAAAAGLTVLSSPATALAARGGSAKNAPLKDTRGYWYGDYWGAISIGYSGSAISNPPKSFKDLLKPEYRGKVALNGSPLSSNSAVSGVLAASLANGGSLGDVGPGIDFFAQ